MEEELSEEAKKAVELVKEMIERDPEAFRESIRETQEFANLTEFLIALRHPELYEMKIEAVEAPEVRAVAEMLKQATEEVKLFFTLLIDCAQAGLEVQKQFDQFRLRSFIRALFAFIEGMTFVLKQFALAQKKRDEIYNAGELAMLLEETHTVTPKGTVEAQQKFIPTDQNFRFALQTAMKAVEPGFVVNASREGWNCFKESIAVRNRITHPKHSTNMVITAAEYEKANKAFLWCMKLLIECGRKLVVIKEHELGLPGNFTQQAVFKEMCKMFGVEDAI